MDLAGRALITIPLLAGAVLLIVLLLGFTWLTYSRGGYVRAAGVVLGTLLGSAAFSWLALALIGAARGGMFWRAHPVWTHLATYASVMLVAIILLATLGRRLEVRQLRATFWLVYLVIGGLIGLFAPGGIIFFLFPPLLALAGAAGSRWWKPAELVGSAVAILFLYLTWGVMLGALEELLNGGPMWLFAPLGALLIIPALIEAKPVVDQVKLRGAAVAAALALAGWAAAAAAPAYSADRQQRFAIQRVTDPIAGKAWWSILNDGAPLPEGFPSSGAWKRDKLPFSDRPRWIAPAPTDPDASAPDVQLLSQVRNGDERTLMLRLEANGAERVELIAPEDSKVRAAGVPGFVRPIDAAAEDGKYFIDCFGRSCDGATLQVVIGQPKPVDFLILGARAPLPPSAALLLAARPKFARPQYNRDESIVFTRRNL
jgi:hypothetical protein